MSGLLWYSILSFADIHAVPAREPKRTYSPAAIETWFDRLTAVWENHFTTDELAKARELYRDCQVRELQLDVGSLIVHRKNGREDMYSVVEWENGAPGVRSGTTDKFEGRALAAAGLYETEELVAMEVSPLPPEKKAALPQPVGTAKGTQAAPPPPPPVLVHEQPAVRPHIRLRLTATTQGVRLSGFWVEGKTEKPAYSSQGEDAAADPLRREILIRLTGRAKHAGFVFRPKKGDFLLRDPLSITAFVKRDLPRWRGTFDVDADPRLNVFGEGVRKVTIKAKARAVEGKGVGLDWSAWIDGAVLERSHASAILRRPGQIVISPELGLLRMDTNQSSDLADWRGHNPVEELLCTGTCRSN